MLEYDKKKLGRILREGRKGKALSQKEVADSVGYSSAQFISNVERGSSVIPLSLLARMIKLYGLDPYQVVALILHGTEKSLRKKLKA